MSIESNDFSIQQAVGSDRASGLSLLLGDHSAEDRSHHVATILASARAGVVSLEHLYVAKEGMKVTGAIWANVVPGRIAGIWPPRFAADVPNDRVAMDLIREVEQALSKSGDLALLQVSLADGDRARDYFAAAGYDPLATLLHLSCSVEKRPTDKPVQLEFDPYQSCDRSRLVSVIEATYQGTLDCPELDTMRETSDCIDGYAAAGDSGTEHWFITRHGGEDVGCLLLARHGGVRLELVYMGLTKSVRGLQLGKALCDHAIDTATELGIAEIFTAVDIRNAPARKLYIRGGFRETDRRSIMVKALESAVVNPQQTANDGQRQT